MVVQSAETGKVRTRLPQRQAQYTALDGSQDSPPAGLLGWALEEQKREDKTGKGNKQRPVTPKLAGNAAH